MTSNKACKDNLVTIDRKRSIEAQRANQVIRQWFFFFFFFFFFNPPVTGLTQVHSCNHGMVFPSLFISGEIATLYHIFKLSAFSSPSGFHRKPSDPLNEKPTKTRPLRDGVSKITPPSTPWSLVTFDATEICEIRVNLWKSSRIISGEQRWCASRETVLDCTACNGKSLSKQHTVHHLCIFKVTRSSTPDDRVTLKLIVMKYKSVVLRVLIRRAKTCVAPGSPKNARLVEFLRHSELHAFRRLSDGWSRREQEICSALACMYSGVNSSNEKKLQSSLCVVIIHQPRKTFYFLAVGLWLVLLLNFLSVCTFLAVNVQLSLEETYADITPVRMSKDSLSAFV